MVRTREGIALLHFRMVMCNREFLTLEIRKKNSTEALETEGLTVTVPHSAVSHVLEKQRSLLHLSVELENMMLITIPSFSTRLPSSGPRAFGKQGSFSVSSEEIADCNSEVLWCISTSSVHIHLGKLM